MKSFSSSSFIVNLLEKANLCQNAIPPDFQAAEKYYKEALSTEGENCEILDAYAEFLCHKGDVEEAESLFKKSIHLQPEEGAMKYFYMGELSCGFDALNFFKKCLSILNISLCTQQDDIKMKERIASVHCAIAELYMSDLCDEAEAETESLNHINQSLVTLPNNFEALCCLATYNKVTGKIDEATKNVDKAVEILEDFQKKKIEEENIDISYPSIESRVNFCRTLIDLDKLDKSKKILEDCIEEDEENIDVWYLLAWTNLFCNDIDEAQECVDRVETILENCSDGMTSENFLNDLNNLQQEIKNKTKLLDEKS